MIQEQEISISIEHIKENCDTIADIKKLVDEVGGTDESH